MKKYIIAYKSKATGIEGKGTESHPLEIAERVITQSRKDCPQCEFWLEEALP